MKFSTKIFSIFLCLIVGVFFVFRLLFLFIYPDSFSNLGMNDTLFAFVDGARFDLSIILTFLGLPLFLLNISVEKKWWFKIWSMVLIFEIYLSVLLLTSDLIYFGFVRRHIGNELLLLGNDVGIILDAVFRQYLIVLVIISISIGLLVWSVWRIIERRFHTSEFSFKFEIPKQILVLSMIVLGIRGTFAMKPINVINAFERGSSDYGNLVLNGFFSSFHTMISSEDIFHDFYTKDAAIDSTVDFFTENDEIRVDPSFPLTRKRAVFFHDRSELEKKYNVVVFILESWSSEFIGCLSDKRHGVTPNFDSLADRGIIYKNFYANGQRSIEGITSILLSIPPIQGMPPLGKGLEISDFFRAGSELKKWGYSTLFIQTARRGSFRVDSIAKGLGFEEFYGMEDFSPVFHYLTDKKPFCGWDYDALMFLKNRLSGISEPFFTVIFTGSTHGDYILPDKHFEKYPHDNNGLNGFLNMLYYSDWSIGEFFKESSKKDWFYNTIFVFTADHALGKYQGTTLHDLFSIPLLIYAPSLLNHDVSGVVGSQVDILPTIIDLIGFEGNYSGVGKSLLRNYQKRAVVFSEGATLGVITNQGFLKHSRTKRLEYFINDETEHDTTLDFMEKLLLSTDQSLFVLLNENRFYTNGMLTNVKKSAEERQTPLQAHLSE